MRKLTKAIIAVLCIVLCISIFFACDPAEEEPAAHEHNYSELKSSATKHWYECPDDGEIKPDSEQAHYDDNRDGKCDLCGHNVTVLDVKGVSFAIAGKDGKTDVSLNGVEVTISYKTNSFKATIADGQFTIGEDTLIPVGTYTVSAEGYNSTTINITKDGIDAAVVVLNKTVNIATSVEIKEIDGVPTLVAEGMIPEIEGATIGNVMLHYDAEYTAEGESTKEKHNFYVANTSDYAGVYHFELKLTDLPNNPDTPWCWFHIYAYAEENPTAESTAIGSVDLNRGDAIEYGHKYTHTATSGIQYIYTIQAEGDGQGLCLAIQATKHIADITITDIKFDSTDGAKLVVKGTYDGGAGYVAIHTDGNGRHYYGQKISAANGEIELTIDLSQITYDDTPWCWFHIYLYEQDPTNFARFDQKINIQRGNFYNAGDYVDVDGVRYSIVNPDQLTIQPTVAPTINNITSVEIKQIEEKPVLVVKGTTSKDVACVKIHSDGGGNHYYSSANVAAKQGEEFEVQLDMTQLNVAGVTYWFHLYTYADAEPADNSAKLETTNIPRSNFEDVQKGKTFDYNDLRYTFKADYENVQMEITNVPKTAVTSIAFDTTNDVPTLVIKGTVADGVPTIKLHIWSSKGEKCWENKAEEAGKLEFRVPVTDLPTDCECWFHIWSYKTENAADNDEHTQVDLGRGDLIEVPQSVVYNGIRYWVRAEGVNQFCIQAVTIGDYDIASVKVDTSADGKPVLVIKGTAKSDIPCVKIHTDGNGDHRYSEGVAVKANEEFTLTFDLTQLQLETTPWYTFHIYIYGDAEGTNKTSNIDLRNWYSFAVGTSWTYNGIKYEVQNESEWRSLVIQPTEAK